MEDKKKSWTQPQLIVLGRGQPEESVLGKCKTTAVSCPTGIPDAGNCAVSPASQEKCKDVCES